MAGRHTAGAGAPARGGSGCGQPVRVWTRASRSCRSSIRSERLRAPSPCSSATRTAVARSAPWTRCRPVGQWGGRQGSRRRACATCDPIRHRGRLPAARCRSGREPPRSRASSRHRGSPARACRSRTGRRRGACPRRPPATTGRRCAAPRLPRRGAAAVEVEPQKALGVVALAAAIGSRAMGEGGMDERVGGRQPRVEIGEAPRMVPGMPPEAGDAVPRAQESGCRNRPAMPVAPVRRTCMARAVRKGRGCRRRHGRPARGRSAASGGRLSDAAVATASRTGNAGSAPAASPRDPAG